MTYMCIYIDYKYMLYIYPALRGPFKKWLFPNDLFSGANDHFPLVTAFSQAPLLPLQVE